MGLLIATSRKCHYDFLTWQVHQAERRPELEPNGDLSGDWVNITHLIGFGSTKIKALAMAEETLKVPRKERKYSVNFDPTARTLLEDSESPGDGNALDRVVSG